MNPTPQVPPEKFVESMKDEIEQYVKDVMQAVNQAPDGEILDRTGATITPGVLELACRENLSATSFAKAAANLARTAQLTISAETLRREVEAASRNRKAADRLLNYVSARQEMIRYPAFRAKGWQIGSGPTESQCKSCTKRLKGHGRRWDRPNATAVAALDTLDRSGQWQKFWPNASPTAV